MTKPAAALAPIVLVLTSVVPADAAPIVERLSPAVGQVGNVVMLEGSGLAGETVSIRFGRWAEFFYRSPTASDRVIRLTVPNKLDPRDPDTVTVTVAVDGVEAATPSGPLQFTYLMPLQPATVTDFTTEDASRPRTVHPHTPFVLTLSGSNFMMARRLPTDCFAVSGDETYFSILTGTPTDTSASFFFPGLGVTGDYEFLVLFSDGSGASIQAPHFVEPFPIFGFPPEIDRVDFTTISRQVQCDFTRMAENFACWFGVLAAQASPGVFIGGSYTQVEMHARVVDPDSTPVESDILLVSASYIDPGDSQETSLVLLDDGSANQFSILQKSMTVPEDCADGPPGACVCQLRAYPLDSSDSVAQDTEFSRVVALVDRAVDPLLQDCIMQQNRQTPIGVAAGSTLDFRIEAVDRSGNLATWPLRTAVTTGAGALTCAGDECGCCLLTSTVPLVECRGKPGMISPDDFPSGVCVSFP